MKYEIKINFDAFKKDHWSKQEIESARLVTDFVQHLMNNHEFDVVRQKFGNDSYVQHNRNMNDGIAGVIETVEQLATRFPDYTYDVKHILVDGDTVSFHSHATINKNHRGNDKRGLNIKDTWIVKNGQIVEHWDAIQPIDLFMRFYMLMTGGRIRNSNGVF